MIDNRLHALRSLSELAPFADSELRDLLPYLDEVEIAAGERLATAGRPCREYLVVLDGRLDAHGCAGDRTLRAGDSTGWVEMWERGCSPETLDCASPVRLLVMGRAQFRAVTALGRRVRG
jgi:hypothetical protein